jgi:hypothetical protein
MKKVYTALVKQSSPLLLKRYQNPVLFIVLMLSGFVSFGQTTYIWNQTGTADWTVAANWTPSRTATAPNDILVFNGGGVPTTPINIPTQTIGQLLISGNTIVNLQGAAAATMLTISGLAGDDLSVTAGSQLNINVATNTTTIFVGAGATGSITGNMTFSAAAHKLDANDANAIIFNSPAIFTQTTGCTGNVFNTAGTMNVVVFSAGTTFLQADGGNPFGAAQPASKVTFQTGSLYKMQQNSAPSFSGRTYANFEVAFAGFNQSPTGTGFSNIDNLTVTLGVLDLNLTAGGINIKGNINVAAGQTLTFTPAAANTLTFNGTSAQSITNAGTLTFGANEVVTINNALGLTVNNNITWNNVVNFTSGIITVPNPTVLTLSSTASVAGVSNASFVDGKVEKIGNTAFIFPVGATSIAGYVPIEISAPALATDAFTAKYVRNSAAALGTVTAIGLDHVSRVDYWVLNRSAGTSIVNIILNWTAQSSSNGSASFITFLPDVTVAHLNTPNWDTYLGELTATGTVTTGQVTRLAAANYDTFALGSISFANPLPINLNYLNGFKQNGSHNIAWKVTCTNNPNVTMSLERSADNRTFTGITTITADAVRCEQPFSFTDNNPLPGTNYYRLKITDANGKISYSAAIAILNAASGFDIVGLLPTLVNNNAILNVTAAQKTKMDVVVTDIAGKQVQKIAYNLIAGSNQFSINLSNLSAGTYQITGYTAEGKSKTIRFVKQ